MELSKHAFETAIGSVVIVIAALFLAKILLSGNIRSITSDGLKVTAKFNNVDGVEVGSDVKIGGVKIGVVAEKFLEVDTYRPVLRLSITKDIKLPIDSNAAIVSSGLLGGKYVDIRIGADSIYIQNDGKIMYTQSSVNLEELIGKFAFGGSK